MTTRLHPRAIDGLDTPGSGAVAAGAVDYGGTLDADNVADALDELDASKSDVGHTHGTAVVLVPLTTTVGGVPELVWDADDNLVMTEVPL